MPLDNVITSPHRRTQSQTVFSPTSAKKHYLRADSLGSCPTLIGRHRFLLTTLGLLGFLCTIYLYFAVTLGTGGDDMCSGLSGAQMVSCHLRHAKTSVSGGKLKLF